jgi:hypothetical protein
MTIDAPAGVAVFETATANPSVSYVEWPAIIAGIVLASAISLILLTFGSAVGLSFTNFRASTGVSPIAIALAASAWLIWVQVGSAMAGGYLTGRMRRRIGDATEHESDVRDGAHGLLVWAGSTLLGAIIIVGGIGAAISAAGSVAATATMAASNVAGQTGATLDPNAYFVDAMFRPAPDAAGTTVVTDSSAARAEASRIFANAMTGPLSDADKAYLAQSVASNTGLTEADAKTRVDQAVTAIDDAKAKALAAAETARKITVLGAFLSAATLLISAVAAYWAAMKGGNHRDKQTVFADVFGRF